MDFTSYVESKKKEARRQNIAQVRAEIDKAWVSEKINNHVANFDGLFSYDEIKEAILSNDIVASKFCKDPAKQNISEKLAEEALKTKKLPQVGKNSIRFNDDGEIVSSASGNTKAADFFINGFYATQKFTMEAGGAQDNQRNDVIDFLKKGSISHKVAAIVDGDYWETYRPILKEMFTDNPNVWITSVSEITGG